MENSIDSNRIFHRFNKSKAELHPQILASISKSILSHTRAISLAAHQSNQYIFIIPFPGIIILFECNMQFHNRLIAIFFNDEIKIVENN